MNRLVCVFLFGVCSLVTACDDPQDTLDDTVHSVADSDPNSDEDTGVSLDDEEEEEGCEEVSLDIKGPTSPRVGDEWVLIMRCDKAVMQGPTVIRFTPPGFASTQGKTVTFTQSGEASMRVQVGGYRVDDEIEVRP